MIDMVNDIERVLISEEELQERIKELGEQISRDYVGKDLVLISVLKGSVILMADLMRAITIPCKIDFLATSLYKDETVPTGEVRFTKDLDKPIAGSDVLIVEDILDSGKTLSFVEDTLLVRNPASIKICTLLDKPERRQVDISPDYVGFTVPDVFVIGYGLDFAQYYRNLPYIGGIKPEAVDRIKGRK